MIKMLEDLVKAKRDKYAEEIKKNYPQLFKEEWLRKEDVDSWHSHLEFKALDSLPIPAREFLVWDHLLAKYYWRSMPCIKNLAKLGNKNPLSEGDMKNITEIMIEQVMKGEEVASSVPLYCDVWRIVGEKDR